jgi:hypothetical protein
MRGGEYKGKRRKDRRERHQVPTPRKCLEEGERRRCDKMAGATLLALPKGV